MDSMTRRTKTTRPAVEEEAEAKVKEKFKLSSLDEQRKEWWLAVCVISSVCVWCGTVFR